MKRIVVASENPVKIAAVREAYGRMFPDNAFDRKSYYREAVIMALIPFKNEHLYPADERATLKLKTFKLPSMTNATDRERHVRLGRHIKDVVYAANDGIVTTFAVVAATVGGSLSPLTILIVGVANLFADGFSMASGDYLGSKSEEDFYAKEEATEKGEVRKRPDEERAEIRDILSRKGYAGAELEDMVRLVTANKTMWVDLMMHDELGMQKPGGDSPLQSATLTFGSFVVAGSIPLLPYIFLGVEAPFRIAVSGTAAALFVIGALRSIFSGRSWIASGAEMLAVGGSAAALSYGIGALLARTVG